MKNSKKMMFLLCLGAGLLATQVRAEPKYKIGDTGVFGSGETWNFNAIGAFLNKVGDSYSARFTVFEDTTVDRAWQRLIKIPEETILKVGIQQDNEQGNPNGEWISSTSYTPPAGNSLAPITFGSVKMEAGKVYHLVIVAEQIKNGKAFVYASGAKNTIRPYDRAADDKFIVMSKTVNKDWVANRYNPFIILGNGDEIIKHIGQPYIAQIIGSLNTQGGNGAACGQQFVITDKEIPADSAVEVDSISIGILARGKPVDPLIISLCSMDGSILSSVNLQPVESDRKVKTLKFDKTATLEQGKSYLLTTRFGGKGGTVKQMYLLPSSVCKIPGSSVAGWGGKTICFPIRSAGKNDWSKFKPVTFTQDLKFILHGKVVAKQ